MRNWLGMCLGIIATAGAISVLTGHTNEFVLVSAVGFAAYCTIAYWD